MIALALAVFVYHENRLYGLNDEYLFIYLIDYKYFAQRDCRV